MTHTTQTLGNYLTTDANIAATLGGSQSAYLYAMLLTTKRPAHTEGERLALGYIEGFVKSVNGGQLPRGCHADKAGNLIVDLRLTENDTVLFSSHYDSAHRADCGGDYVNKVAMLNATTLSGVDACIGADDASGIYVMARMIEAGVPALYIFHAAEEVGGIGSHYIASRTPDLLKGITHAIAFDRRGTTDVVWMQGGEECADQGTAGVLAHILNQANTAFAYKPSDRGSFTDTKLYRHLVPECFNVSIGYDNEHTARETQDVAHLVRLAQACITLDWRSLPTWRDPSEGYNDSWYGDSWRSYAHKPNIYGSYVQSYEPAPTPEDFSAWEDFFAADFDTAIDYAYEVATLGDVDMLDFLEGDDPQQHNTVFNMLNKHYPLQQTQGDTV